MRTFMSWLEKLIGLATMLSLGGILLFVSLQVLFRFILGNPLPWPEELSRLLFIYLVFIGGAEASLSRTHISIDVVDAFGFPPSLNKGLEIVRGMVILATMGVVVYGAWVMLPAMHSMHLPATGFPVSVMVLPVLAGSVLMAFYAVWHLIQDLKRLFAEKTAAAR